MEFILTVTFFFFVVKIIFCFIDKLPTVQKKSSVIAPLEEVDYMDGPQFERWFADLLKMLGYTGVYVTPGSGDQGIDVVAVKDGIKYGFQCKCYSRDVGNTPVQEAVAGLSVYGCAIGVAVTNRHFTKGAIELAKLNSIMLIDRERLREMIDEANSGVQSFPVKRKREKAITESTDRYSLWPHCDSDRIDARFFKELPHVELEPGMKEYIYMYPYIPDADPHSLKENALITIISEPFESKEFADHFARALTKHCCARTEVLEDGYQYRVKATAHVRSIQSYYYDHDDNGKLQYCFANWA